MYMSESSNGLMRTGVIGLRLALGLYSPILTTHSCKDTICKEIHMNMSYRTLLDHYSHWSILPLSGDMGVVRNSGPVKIEESTKIERYRRKTVSTSGHFLSFPGERHSPTMPVLRRKKSESATLTL